MGFARRARRLKNKPGKRIGGRFQSIQRTYYVSSSPLRLPRTPPLARRVLTSWQGSIHPVAFLGVRKKLRGSVILITDLLYHLQRVSRKGEGIGYILHCPAGRKR